MGNLPFSLCPNESSGDNNIVISANSSLRWAFSNDQSGIISVRFLSMLATSDSFLVEVTDTFRNAKFSNRPLHAKTILGTMGKPFFMPFPFILPKLQTLQIELTDLSGAENSVRLAFSGMKDFSSNLDSFFKDEKLNRNHRAYFLTTDSAVSLGSGELGQNYVSVDSGDFLCFGINSYSTANFGYKIYDVNLGRSWQNGYVPSSQFGTAENQHYFYKPVLIKNMTKLRVDFKNLSSATNNIYITLYGVLLG